MRSPHTRISPSISHRMTATATVTAAPTANHPLHDATHLQVLRLLQANPHMSQRELAQALGVSLGKTNFCVQALLAKGWLKMQSFSGNQRKLAYAYLLTPTGISEKALLTARFLTRKMQEYEALRLEIDALQQETAQHATPPSPAAQRGNPSS